MEKTGIIWTESTINPFRAINKKTGKKGWFCIKVSQGCRFCYAETLNMKWGNKLEFSHKNLNDVEFVFTGMKEPFKWKKPTLAFVNSMTDFFLPQIPDEHRHLALDVIEKTPQHEYQVLTKHPDYMYEFTQKRKLPANFWAGVSIPDNKAISDGSLQYLRKTEAKIKFISAEPIIEKIDFKKEDLRGIDWIITGGESGTHLWNGEICEKRALVLYNRTKKKWEAREDRMDWIRSIRDICIDLNIKLFHKQWGGSYPEAAGRLLDGRTWNEMPRYPGDNNHINNAYLKKIEAEIGNTYGQPDLFTANETV